jgi:hypothetical protein
MAPVCMDSGCRRRAVQACAAGRAASYWSPVWAGLWRELVSGLGRLVARVHGPADGCDEHERLAYITCKQGQWADAMGSEHSSISMLVRPSL